MAPLSDYFDDAGKVKFPKGILEAASKLFPEANGEVITSYEALENEWQKSNSAAGLTFEEWLMINFTITRNPKTT